MVPNILELPEALAKGTYARQYVNMEFRPSRTIFYFFFSIDYHKFCTRLPLVYYSSFNIKLQSCERDVQCFFDTDSHNLEVLIDFKYVLVAGSAIKWHTVLSVTKRHQTPLYRHLSVNRCRALRHFF